MNRSEPEPLNMLWRRPTSAGFSLAVNESGELILGYWDGDSTPYVMEKDDEMGYMTQERSHINYPEVTNWGTSASAAELGGDNDVEIDYEGQHYTMANDGSSFTPELADF